MRKKAIAQLKMIAPVALTAVLGIVVAVNYRMPEPTNTHREYAPTTQISTEEEPIVAQIDKYISDKAMAQNKAVLENAGTYSEIEITTCHTETICAVVPTLSELIFEPYESLPISDELQKEIWDISHKYEFDFEFLLAWGLQESGLNPDCIGDSGKAIGMYQIQPQWWQGLADEHGLDLRNPVDNCECACIILNRYLEHTQGDYTMALSLYRWGDENNTPEADGRTYEEHINSRYAEIY